MTARTADFLPQKINQFVPSMSYAADAVMEGPFRAQLGAPDALDLNGIVAAQDMTAAGNLTSFASAYSSSVMGKYGRCVTITASGAGVKVVTITGRDYLGQPMIEDITLNGGTPVGGQKAFKYIEKVAWLDQNGIDLDVGWNDILGLPYKAEALLHEFVDETGAGFVVAPNAGTFAAGDETTVTATTNDPRGTYLPITEIPDGTRIYDLMLAVDRTELHGVAHFFA